MRKTLISLAASAVLAFGGSMPAFAQAGGPQLAEVTAACGTATYSVEQAKPILQTQAGLVCVGASVTPSGTQNVNLSQVNGGTVAVGAGASNPQTQRVITSTDSTIGVEGIDGSTQASPTNGFPVVGPVASGVAASGNPNPIGCDYMTTPPTFTNAQRAQIQCGTRGSVDVTLFGQDSATAVQVIPSANDGQSISFNGLLTKTYGYSYNGTSEDKVFTCPNSAVVNVIAAATTQVVALAASQVVRVCSFSVAMSAAGTAKWVYGTGTNCAAGTTDLTGAMPLATGIPWSYSNGMGSVIRTASANALCVVAVTGNVVGVVTYAQY